MSTQILRFHPYEMSKTGKLIETENRSVVALGGREWEATGQTGEGNGSFLGSLKQIVGMDAPICEYTLKTIDLYTLNG